MPGSPGLSPARGAAAVLAPLAVPRDIPLVTYAEDLPIVRRYWRTVLGKQLTARAAVTVPNLHAVVSALNTLFLVQRPGAAASGNVQRVRDCLRAAARTW